jgi:hypothetical protein
LALGAAVQHFVTAKAAEGASPKTIEWYRMVLGRATRDLGARRPLDALTSTELRTRLLGLRATLSPISVSGYVRGLKAFGTWCEGLVRESQAGARCGGVGDGPTGIREGPRRRHGTPRTVAFSGRNGGLNR